MAGVSEEFREQWLECQEEYGKNIEAGDIPVMTIDRMDMAVTLPAVRYTAPYNPNGDNRFDSYCHIPMQTFKTFLDNLAAAAEAAIDGVEELKDQTEAARDGANQAATAANQSRVAIEANEGQRQSNETTRQQQESAREQQSSSDHSTATQDHTRAEQDHTTADTDHGYATSDHTTATTDHGTAGTDHTRAEQDHSTATTDHGTALQDHNTATQDHSASVAATQEASNVNADLTGMTVTITDRNGVSRSVNIGFEIDPSHVYTSKQAMIDDAANIRAGQFCMIATTDPTATDNATLWSRNSQPASAGIGAFTFLSDLDQASSSAWADWMNNYKPVIEGDHTRAENDHSTASTDHSTATQDHTTAGTDHQTAEGDHTRAETDHGRAETDHQTADGDHTRAEQDHTTADTDHGYATSDHTTAQDDHGIATSDHGTAQTDHGTATNDHQTATDDHDAAVVATAHAEEEGDRAQGYNDHPMEVRQDGYIWVWNEDTETMVRTNKMIINFDELTEAQKQAMADAFYSTIVYASVAESQSAAQELT